jgi:phage terminase large subunit GpA-like protein
MQSLERIPDPSIAYGQLTKANGTLELYPAEAEAMRPAPRLPVSEWADRERILQPGVSRQPGPWQTATTPYLREIMDAYVRRRTRHLVLCCGTQLGKTETLYNLLGYIVDLEPYSTLLLYPTEDSAKEISRTRIQPMIDGCPALEAKKPAEKKLYQMLEMHFPGMVLYMTGANSVAALSQKPCRNIFRDEIDKYPTKIGVDADPLSLSEERAKSFWDIRKVVDVSTPTLEHMGIWSQLQSCDVIRHFEVPCPHCGEYQKLDFKRVKWTTEGEGTRRLTIARNTAKYTCSRCDLEIGDEYKAAMLDAGKWVDDREPEFPPEKVGFHLSSLYSPWLRWGDMAEQFIKANEEKKIGNKKPLQNFINGWLAEPWQEYEAKRDEDIILSLCDDRDRGIIPAESVLAMTAGVDVQENGFYFVIRAWGVDLQSWLVREGFVETFETIERVLWASYYKTVDGTEYIIGLTFIDSGYRTTEVYDFVRGKNYARATKGEQKMANPTSITRIDSYPGTSKQIPGGVQLIRVNTTYYKNWLSNKLELKPWDPGAFHLHGQLQKEPPDEYATQMVSEYYNEEKGIWETFRGRANHYWDCEVLALAAADFMGVKYIGIPTKQEKAETKAKKKVKKRGGRRW